MLLELLMTFYGNVDRAIAAYPVVAENINKHTKMDIPLLDFNAVTDPARKSADFDKMAKLMKLEGEELASVLAAPPAVTLSAEEWTVETPPVAGPSVPPKSGRGIIKTETRTELYKCSKFSQCGHQSSQLSTHQGHDAIFFGGRVAEANIVTNRKYEYQCKNFESCHFDTDRLDSINRHQRICEGKLTQGRRYIPGGVDGGV